MERIRVFSSHIVSVGYDTGQKILEVEFKDGKVYQYLGVPSQIYDQMMDSDSKGTYLHRYVRNKYKFLKV